MVRRSTAIAIGAAALVMSACAPEPNLPNLQEIYSDFANTDSDAVRTPLIVVPGTLGSRLIDSETGAVVWGGGSAGISADPSDPEEARLLALPIPGVSGRLSQLSDSVVPAGVLDTARANVLGIPVDIEVYGGINRTLLAGGFRSFVETCKRIFGLSGPARERIETPENCTTAEGLTPDQARIPGPAPAPLGGDADGEGSAAAALGAAGGQSLRFDYDWRRDLPGLAMEFHAFVMAQKERIAAEQSARLGRPVPLQEIRFDLLAHSMGGLITRYYLMHGPVDLPADGSLPPVTWAGAQHFSRVVFVAPPNAGSVIAFDNLVNGKDFGPFQPFYPAPLLATHANAWQLMPRARHRAIRWEDVDGPPVTEIYDPALWERFGWGLAGPAAGPLLALMMPEIGDATIRRQRALVHQARLLARAEHFHRAMDRWGDPPAHLRLFLVVGGGFRTPAVATVDRQTGAVTIAGVEEGDGVVTRASVLLDERRTDDLRTSLISPLRFDTVLLLPDEHVELTKNPVFGDNLLFWLLEQPRSTEALAAADRPGAAPPVIDPRPAGSRPAALERVNTLEGANDR